MSRNNLTPGDPEDQEKSPRQPEPREDADVEHQQNSDESANHQVPSAPELSREKHVELAPLAESLGVTSNSLAALGVYRGVTGYFYYPEWDADGARIGEGIRSLDGKKWFRTGGRRGIIRQNPFPAYAGSSPNAPVAVTEGLSDAAAAFDCGLNPVAVPSAGSAIDHLKPLLKDRHVLIFADNDDSGFRNVAKLGRELQPLAASIRVVQPPQGVKDLREWYTSPAGLTAEEVMAAAETFDPLKWSIRSGQERACTRRISEIERKQLQWLWLHLIPLGKITMCSGDPGLGKSMMMSDLTARITKGLQMPGDRDPRQPGGVVMLNAEDDPADTMRPRLEAAGADLDLVTLLEAVRGVGPGDQQERPVDLTRDIDAVAEALMKTPNPLAVIVDPISAYCGGTDTHNNAEVRSFLMGLKRLAEEFNVAIICVSHLRKSEGRAIYRTNGSLGFTAAARVALMVMQDPHTDDGRLLLCVKNNLALDVNGFRYEVHDSGDGPTVQWDPDPLMLTPDDVFAEVAKSERGNADEAAEFLRELLAGGKLPSKVVAEKARAAGYSPDQMRRALYRLDGVSQREGFGPGSQVFWRLREAE